MPTSTKRKGKHPKHPAYYRDCKQRLAAQAESVIVLAGPQEWVWKSAENWQSTGEWGVLVLSPDTDPQKLNWDVCKDQEVRVWYWRSHVDIDALSHAIVKFDPRLLIAVDIASDNPVATIRRYDRGS